MQQCLYSQNYNTALLKHHAITPQNKGQTIFLKIRVLTGSCKYPAARAGSPPNHQHWSLGLQNLFPILPHPSLWVADGAFLVIPAMLLPQGHMFCFKGHLNLLARALCLAIFYKTETSPRALLYTPYTHKPFTLVLLRRT